MTRRASRRRRFGGKRAALVAVAILAIVLPFGLDAFQLTTATFVLIAAIGALGLNVLTGYTGQISLGHAFFLAVGAYTAAVLGGNDHLSALIWLPAAGVVAALCGAIVGPTALRLRGLYLAIVTIGLVFIGQHIWFNAPAISGGPGGRSFPSVAFGSFDFSPGQQLTLGGLVIDHNGLYYYLALILLAAAMLFVWNLTRGRSGRAMQAVRDREIAAAIMGVNLARTKMSAFVVSSFLTGVSGALYASYLSFATPGQWSLLLSVQYVAAIIVGGIGTVWGALLGSTVIFALPAVLQSLFPQSSSGGVPIDDITSIAYGVLIIVFFVLEPHGVVGLGRRVASLWSRMNARRGEDGPLSHEAQQLERSEATWAR
ncbi:MAG: branched-chain amino acid transporter permease [Solirubrobacterales bacterium]|jgi:branched-chain amino acid transport system permease protein|nr:branched-chain amino acid transporter permease [Solirubrobacterales bacterium]